MTDWPDKPLIRIIRGTIGWKPIANEIARKTEKGNFAVANRLCVTGIDGDSIDAWEEVTAVPTATLKRLQQAFRGVDKNTCLAELTQELFSYLPADKPSPLDRAVTDTKNIGARGILEEFPLNDRIALLLAAVNRVHVGEDRRYRLAWLVRLAYTWADLEDPSKDALQSICNRAGTEVGRCGGDLATLARQAGDVAAYASEKHSPRPALIALGARALAWAAEIIEEEDK
jgi:hypothetical protein|nr:MAG TPA: hypothetical protein [Caudoviricetes sp.]